MEEEILQWLNNNDITNPEDLKDNNYFIAFLMEDYPEVDGEVLRSKVNELRLFYKDNAEDFSSGLSKALDNIG